MKIALSLAAVLLVGSLVALGGCAPEEGRTKYLLNVEYFPETQELSGDMTVTVFNGTDEAFTELPFFLAPNAYREGAKYPAVSHLYAPAAYYDGKSYGNVSVSGEGASVGGEDENILYYSLAEPIFPDESQEVSLSFTTKFARVNHRLGVGERCVNLSFFYPQLCARGEDGWLEYAYHPLGDPFVFECADYEVILTIPINYGCVYGGEGARTEENGKAIYRVQSKNARDCAFVLGEDMRTATQTVGGVSIECFAFGEEPSPLVLRAASDSLAFYSQTFGDYPRSRYAVVQTDLCVGGMEYTGLSMLSRSLREEEIAYVTAHETAHQWWYARVGSNQVEESWQDEGLTEYSTALFFGAFPSYGLKKEEVIGRAERAYRAFFSVYAQTKGGADTSMSRSLSAFSGEYEYENIAYHKGMLLFDRLSDYLGEEKFLAGLKKYAADAQNKLVVPQTLANSLGGRRAEEFILSFTEGKCVI